MVRTSCKLQFETYLYFSRRCPVGICWPLQIVSLAPGPCSLAESWGGICGPRQLRGIFGHQCNDSGSGQQPFTHRTFLTSLCNQELTKPTAATALTHVEIKTTGRSSGATLHGQFVVVRYDGQLTGPSSGKNSCASALSHWTSWASWLVLFSEEEAVNAPTTHDLYANVW